MKLSAEHGHDPKMGGGAKAAVGIVVVVAIVIPILLGYVLVHGSLPAVTSTVAPPTTSTSGTSSGVTVIMPQGIGSDQSLNFEPSAITVVVGVNNTITFLDEDSSSGAPHNVWFTGLPSGATNPNTAAGQVSFYELTAGQSVTFTLTTPGTYTYECQFHSTWMHGTITVAS